MVKEKRNSIEIALGEGVGVKVSSNESLKKVETTAHELAKRITRRMMGSSNDYR